MEGGARGSRPGRLERGNLGANVFVSKEIVGEFLKQKIVLIFSQMNIDTLPRIAFKIYLKVGLGLRHCTENRSTEN